MTIRRRELVALLAGALSAWPGALSAQQGRLPRIALLAVTMPPAVREALFQGLADYGYSDGKTVTVDVVTASTYAELTPLIERAVRAGPDLILAWGATA